MSNVNHPSHYNKEGKKECIVAMQETFGVRFVIDFCLGNCYKYSYRRGSKADNSYEQDTEKIKWYLDYATNLVQEYNLMKWYTAKLDFIRGLC